MSAYLALCDLDDTLLTHDKKITKETIEYLQSYATKGNYFCICTGRPKSGCIHFYHDLGLNMPLVTDNGCAIYNLDGKDIFFTINLDIFNQFLKETKDYIAAAYTTTPIGRNFCQNRPLVPWWIIHDENNDIEVIEGNIYEINDTAPLICNYWIKEECYDEFEQVILNYKEHIFFRKWGTENGVVGVEIHSINASKGNALKYLKEYFGIDDDKTMAFGDQLNDESMIKEAYYGVAMVNAIDALKALTNHQTEYDYDHNGVIHFIKSVLGE